MSHPRPATASYEADVDPRIICAPVLREDDDFDMHLLGRIEHAHRHDLPLTPNERAARHYLASNGYCQELREAYSQYGEHLEATIRRNGGTIITETTGWRDGRRTVTRTVEQFTAPTVTPTVRTAPRPRERRSTRTGSSSTTSGNDPGDSDPHEPPVALARPATRAVPVSGVAERVVAGWLAVGARVVAAEEARR